MRPHSVRARSSPGTRGLQGAGPRVPFCSLHLALHGLPPTPAGFSQSLGCQRGSDVHAWLRGKNRANLGQQSAGGSSPWSTLQDAPRPARSPGARSPPHRAWAPRSPGTSSGRRPQPREAFTARRAAAEQRTALPVLPSPHVAVTRAGERSAEAELRSTRRLGSPHRLPAASTPGQEPMRPEAEAVACASVRAGDRGERGQGLPCLQGRRQPEQELGAQMTGRSCQRGGGRLRVFVLGEEAGEANYPVCLQYTDPVRDRLALFGGRYAHMV